MKKERQDPTYTMKLNIFIATTRRDGKEEDVRKMTRKDIRMRHKITNNNGMTPLREENINASEKPKKKIERQERRKKETTICNAEER